MHRRICYLRLTAVSVAAHNRVRFRGLPCAAKGPARRSVAHYLIVLDKRPCRVQRRAHPVRRSPLCSGRKHYLSALSLPVPSVVGTPVPYYFSPTRDSLLLRVSARTPATPACSSSFSGATRVSWPLIAMPGPLLAELLSGAPSQPERSTDS